VDRSLERQGGLGIGFTLSRQLIELHGGTIEAMSRGVGHGSEFVIRLPIERLRQAPEPAPQTILSTRHRRRILVVDDNQDSAESLTLLLRAAGHEASLATDGRGALRMAQDLRPEVVFLDIGMPRMNGYEVARRLRQQPWAKRTRLVALTGWGQEEDRRLAHEAGFDDHLVKPASAAALSELLSSVGETSRGHVRPNAGRKSGRRSSSAAAE